MPDLVPIDHDRLLETFLRLVRIDSYHGHEDRIVEVLEPMLHAVGLTTEVDAHGNLIARWEAQDSDAEPLMLNAHMDTVWPTPGMEPVVTDEGGRVGRLQRARRRRQGRRGGHHGGRAGGGGRGPAARADRAGLHRRRGRGPHRLTRV